MEGSDGLDGVGATDGLDACFREAEVLHLALVNEVLHGSRDVFDGDVGINTVLIVEIDGIDPKPLERSFGGLPDVLWPAIQSYHAALFGIDLETELGGNHDLRTVGSEGFTDEFLVGEWAVGLGGIEESYAAINGGMEKRDHLLLVSRRTIRHAHSHAAEPEGRDFQIAFSKFAFLHCFSLRASLGNWPNQSFWSQLQNGWRLWLCMRWRNGQVR